MARSKEEKQLADRRVGVRGQTQEKGLGNGEERIKLCGSVI